ncbi:hypothetical protein B0A48_13995 [Cryoendolithus antarcticus]|uniref:Vacuolar membrane-associated protein IML1 n=1 Tax=Cryoendolithus antarcticus TaxID=1507870 RepID=A0A1V8SMH0_9PEZI|nr:hypothetical protein B0A48_13995 [Cryoendolithus antarcticus]
MAARRAERLCTVVLHENRTSTEDVLCGTDVLPTGKVGLLTAKGAKCLTVLSKARAAGQKEISLHISLATRFGYENRMSASIVWIEDIKDATANHVEFLFRDLCLARADIHRMVLRLDGDVIYRDQKVHDSGSETAVVRAIYAGGQESDAALIDQSITKTIWRSGGARYTILIQLSEEMLGQWRDGDLMYERAVNGYLIELFHRWDFIDARHHFSMVLFGRTGDNDTEGNQAESASGSNDFYQIVCQDRPSAEWRDVIENLMSVLHNFSARHGLVNAAQGNMLHAIYLSALDYVGDNSDPALGTTGNSIIAVTAGTGMFECGHGLLKRATNLLLGNSIGVDIVALASEPLHPVPLFKYQLGDGIEYALPHWADVSFWPEVAGHTVASISTRVAKTIELVMLPSLQTAFLDKVELSSADEIMDAFDLTQFGPGLQSAAFIPAKTDVILLNEAVPTAALTTLMQASSNAAKLPKAADDNKSEAHPTSDHVVRSKSSFSGTLRSRMSSQRKISLGPRGLAPMTGAASAVISTHSAGQSVESSSKAFKPDEASSGLAKQIRESLARRSSQQSLASQYTADIAPTVRPIDIGQSRSPAVRASDLQATETETLDGQSLTAGDLADAGISQSQLSRTPKLFPSLGSIPEIEAQNLAQQALTPWLTLLNPSNPRQDNMRIANQYRKWHHVFPKAINSGSFKWKSMCTPAVLPLSTDVIPSARELDKHYERRVWRLTLSSLDDTANGSSALLRRLVSLRLARGFQLASKTRLTDIGNGKCSMQSILMSVGTLYHHIEALSDFEMQITEYTANSHEELLPPGLELSTMHYFPRIARVGSTGTRPVDIDLARGPSGQEWSVLDRALLDEDSVNASEHKSVMRLVLLPSDVSRPNGDSDTIRSRELTDDERRIEGIQKLAQLWQRDRIFSAEDRSHQVSMKRSTLPTADRDPNPLAIDFQTLDPSIVVNAQDMSSGYLATGSEAWAPLFVESEMYHSSEFDLTHLLRQMQDAPPRGVDLRDRRWFTRTHLNCFRGDEMTSWLLSAFKDVQTRGEAVAVGNEIMECGAFNHVRGQHRFRDGNYFYQIASPYRTTQYPDTATIFTKSAGRSVPPTPIMEARFSPAMKSAADKSDSNGTASPHVHATARKQVLLSQMLQYDVDPSRSSDQQGVVELHYDRIHNPENCYHIRLSWLTTTHKLVRDAISRWSTLANSHGLTLVQVPVKEASEQHQSHPFDRPHRVRLAYRPPHQLPTTPTISQRHSSALSNDNRHFLKAVMRKLDFVLDFESAHSFSTKLNVTYSWGPLDYTRTQFVHRSGLVLGQICTDEDEVDIMLLQNRLASAKLALASSSRNVEDIMQSVDDFCSDEGKLQKLYNEGDVFKGPAPSPSSKAFMNGADIDVPPMHLPPHLLR